MTKNYIVTKDKIESTVTTSDYPASATAVQTELAKKLDVAQGMSKANKIVKTDSEGNITFGEATAQVQSDWNATDTSASAFIQNKPFKTVGTGLTVTEGVLSADTQLHFQIFETLPTAAATYAQTIGLVLKSVTETGNLYKEYACVNVSATATPDWKWEQIGETQFELSIEQTAAGIKINNTDLQSASSAQKGLLTATDHVLFSGKQDALTFDDTPTADSNNPVKSGGIKTALNAKEDTANRVSAWSSTVSHNKYPTEKLVKDALDAKADIVEGTVAIGHDSIGYYFNE